MIEAIRRLLGHVARPARQDEGGEGLVVEPYRGYGNRHEIFVMGRVYRQPGGRAPDETGDLVAGLRRLLRRGAAGRTVKTRFGGSAQSVATDRAGYFRLHLRFEEPQQADGRWLRVPLCLELPSGRESTGTADVFVPPDDARFVVISDIDDTVMLTGVAQKVKMFWRLFAQGAASRVAFPGVAALYRALHGRERNPILYVSRGPWSIYSMLEEFFQMHRIPVGPVLFLRDWGLSFRRPLPRRAPEHKLELIRDMLVLYDDVPFVLIGDSGQHDPEIYARIVRENPGRVAAVFIRNVGHDSTRAREIDALAQEVLDAGSSLLLASDSVAMAEHAAELGLVPQSAVAEVANDRSPEERRQSPRPVGAVRRKSREETKRAVADGELDETLAAASDEPPSTVVEAENHRRVE
ncbi:MAG: DUF2183 domain-containing protein [Gammaproteobacteria bacterium]|nr:DUF2183 domain-containing protein [Gammaproteobacteria bacterium]